MRLLAIDPGTNRTGFSVIDYKDEIPLVVYAGTALADRLIKKESWISDIHGARFNRIIMTGEELYNLLVEYTPDAVVSESPFMGSFAQSFAALTEMVYEFKKVVMKYNTSMPLEVISPSEVKKFMGVKGTSGDKDLMKEALNKKVLSYVEFLNPADLDEHAIDAICINLWFADYLNQNSFR